MAIKDMKFDLPLETKNSEQPVEKPPINSGEIFEAEKDFLNLKKYHGEEGLEKVAEFKEKLKYQKSGMVAVESKIINYLNNGQNFAVTEMNKMIADDLDKYGFGKELREKLDGFFKAVVNRSINIKKTVSDCLDENNEVMSSKLFEKLFYRPAIGEIKVEVDNLSIYFRLSNEDDFAYIASGAYKRRRMINNRDREIAQSTGGQSLSDYPSARLRGLILIETPDYYQDEENHLATKLHEEQHAFNYFWKDFEFSDYELGLKKFSNLKKGAGSNLAEDELDEWAMMLVTNNPKIESNIKDEISAYFKGGTHEGSISRELLSNDTIYEYSFKYDLIDIDRGDGTLNYKYQKMVEQGIIAFARLLDNGYPYEAAHALLYTEPLVYWLKIANRMTGEKMTSEVFAEWEKKYISPEIIAQMEETKKFELDELTDGES